MAATKTRMSSHGMAATPWVGNCNLVFAPLQDNHALSLFQAELPQHIPDELPLDPAILQRIGHAAGDDLSLPGDIGP
jgi:hypothetical protein